MKTIIYILTFLISVYVYSQVNEDVGVIDLNDPPTTIYTNSKNFLESKNKGFELINIISTGCDDSYDPFSIVKRIITTERNDTSIIITVGFSEVCCVSFLGDLKISNDTVDLLYKTYGNECECMCCYNLIYSVKTEKEINNFKLNGTSIVETDYPYKTFPLKFEIYNNDTINRHDKYGLKQGTFLTFNEKGDTLKYILYRDNHEIEEKGYYENGKIRYWTRRTGLNWSGDGSFSENEKYHTIVYDKEGDIIKDEIY